MTDMSTLVAALPAQRRAALAVLLARRAAPAVTAEQQTPTGCSFEQERLWLLRQLEAGGPAMPNATFGLRLRGPVEVPALRTAFAAVVARHEALRTVITAGPDRPCQTVLPPGTAGFAPLHVLDATGHPGQAPPPSGEAAAARSAEAAAARFDLAAGPLCALSLIRLGERDHALLFAGDHLAFDEQSVSIVRRDLADAYAAALAGRPWTPPALTVRYRDYAAWSTSRLTGPLLDRRLEYWNRQLAEPRPLTALSTSDVHSGSTVSVRTALPAGALTRLRQAGGPGTTDFAALLTVLDVVLARHAGEPDVTVGTVYSARERAELEPLVGCFLNPLALRTDLTGVKTFAEAASRVRRTVTGAIANAVPFQHVVARLRPGRPFFRVTLAVHRYAEDLGAWPGLDAEVWHHEVGTDTLDLAVEAVPTPDGGAALTFRCPAGTVLKGLPERFHALVASIVEHPTTALFPPEAVRPCDLPARTPEPSGTTVVEMIAAHVAATPEAVAVDAADAVLTYAELDRAATGLAHALRERGVGRDDVVAVCLGRGAGLVTALLGVWRAGGAYLPLHPSDPVDRWREVCAAAGVRHLVTDAAVALGGIEVIRPDDGTQGTVEEAPHPDDLAYVVFTSGSTGRPKGVAVPHGALAARVRWMTGAYGLSPADRVLQFADVTFDTHAEEVYPTLAAGATLVVAPGERAALPDFLATPAGAALTVLDLPTPYWHELVALGATWPGRLRLMIIGADQAQPHAVAAWRERFGDRVSLLNTYGPTETTVIATAAHLGAADTRRRPPIGRPIAGTAAYVLDDQLQPVPGGFPGELYLAGVGLARGYLGRPGATAERFLPDPFGPPGARMYRTGDRVRLGPDGELEFLGRTDNQLKIRGYRVEPGEAEARLQAHPLVRWAVVVPRDQRLVGYLIPADGAGPDTVAAVRRDLAAVLPAYLVPEAFVVLDEAPLTGNGKVDVAALPDPRPDLPDEHTRPRTDGEELVAEVFAEVLGLTRIGVHDDFFALGGHSLHAIRVVGRIRAATDLDVPIVALFECPTVAALTAHLEAMLAEDDQ